METSREDVSISIRSAFLKKGTQQRFSLFALAIISILLIFIETIDSKPLNIVRSILKDVVYRSAVVANYPNKIFTDSYSFMETHLSLYKDYEELKKENQILKGKYSKSEFLEMENSQLKQLIDEQVDSDLYLISAKVMLEEESPYLNSVVINAGSNKEIKKGMAVLDGENFVGRIVNVNFFSSRVLLITDLNSKIPVIIEPSGSHAIVSGHGHNRPSLEYLPKNKKIDEGNKIYTSGKEGIFTPGIPIGEVKFDSEEKAEVELFSEINQITYVNINLNE